MVWILAGCSSLTGSETVPEPAPAETQVPTPGKVPAAKTESEVAYVIASKLRMRAAPSADLDALSTLAINTRVRLGTYEGDWVQVNTPDGRSGWVKGTFTSTQKLTPELIDQAIAAAITADERLTWWQRAAALRPMDPAVLEGLANAYSNMGQVEAANQIRGIKTPKTPDLPSWFPEQHAVLAKIGPDLEAASTADALFAVWGRARTLVREMDEPLATRFDSDTHELAAGADELLEKGIPWAFFTRYAEGTAPALELRAEPFVAAAARTPEPYDDAFFALITSAYDNAGGYGWAAWQDRNWDYGGRSTLGNGQGMFLDLLKRTDTMEGKPVPDLVGRIREDLIEAIAKDSGMFEYCTGGGKPTPVEGLVGETKAILEQVTLTPDERKILQDRVDTQFGRG